MVNNIAEIFAKITKLMHLIVIFVVTHKLR